MKKTTLAASLVLSLGVASSAFAADGTITITGKITDQTCEIKTGTNGNFTVPLPTVKADALKTADSTAGKTPFTITLEGCKAASAEQSVAAFFEYNPDNVNLNTGRLVNKGAAGNVEIQLLNDETANKNPVFVGKNVEQQGVHYRTLKVSGTTASATLSYAAQYYATGTASAGDVQAKVDYTIVYK